MTTPFFTQSESGFEKILRGTEVNILFHYTISTVIEVCTGWSKKTEKGLLSQNGGIGRGEVSQRKTLDCHRQFDSCTKVRDDEGGSSL